jgi:uncharacterized membrane protein YGL010W
MIHIFGVPVIVTTLFSLGMYLPFGQVTGCYCQAHIGMILLLMSLGLYLKLDFVAGVVSCFVYTAAYFIGNQLFLMNGESHLKFVLICQVLAWGGQFIGHAIEGRKPALLDNLLLTLAAPFFVVLEVMMMFGYKAHLHKLLDNIKED